MKIKIQEIFNTTIPKYEHLGNNNIFTIKITDKFKYLVLPVKITPIKLDRSKYFLLFYDGTTGGRTGSSEFASLGAEFMPSLYSTDPYWKSAPTYNVGWTSGTPFGYITKKEIENSVQVLVEQGLTASSKKYVWMNFETPWENYILFNGYTGPTTVADGISQGIASNFYYKLLKGGIGSDGMTFFGLKDYFPGISFGYYGQPRWVYYLLNSNIWTIPEAQIDSILDFAANVWVGCTGLADAVDMLMPSLYSSLNSPYANRLFSYQNLKLSKKINQKLQLQGKSPKKIIPFISSVYFTDSTGSPYTTNASFPSFKYIPPYTVMLDEDTKYECVEPIIESGCDGLIVWNAPDYAFRTATSTVGAAEPLISAGSGSWRLGPTGGLPNPWTNRAIQRQALSAHENYTRGVCMGITGNRWWWRAGPETETYTPTEWKPLNVNPIAGSTSSDYAKEITGKILTNAVYNQLNLAKTLWSELNND